jgi:hypothetical protein
MEPLAQRTSTTSCDPDTLGSTRGDGDADRPRADGRSLTLGANRGVKDAVEVLVAVGLTSFRGLGTGRGEEEGAGERDTVTREAQKRGRRAEYSHR